MNGAGRFHVRSEFTAKQQARPDFNEVILVHSQQLRRCHSGFREPFNQGPVQAEMIVPALPPWMKQGYDLPCYWRNRRQVWPFA